MPTNSTRKSGPTTSRMPLPAAPATSAGVGLRGADEVAARFFIRLELHHAALFRLLEKIGKGAKAVIRLVEARLAALERLLDHRAPDALVLAALGDERVQRLEHQVEGLLLLVLVVAGGRRLPPPFLPAALLLLPAPPGIVVDSLRAVGGHKGRGRGLYA